jgi:hypothetical protein
MPPLTTACPVCDAQPGEECNWKVGMLAKPRFRFHQPRTDAAAYIQQIQNPATPATGEPTVDQLDQAAEASGLV